MARKVGPLVVVVGETASGKSSLALELAKKFDGELICADSLTVYKEFNIGTAKPTQLERAEVPHHLLDVVDARKGFSAAVFQQLAFAEIDSITSRGRLPILVGGTGLYIDSIIYNYGFLEAPSESMRSELEAMELDDLVALAERRKLIDLSSPHVDLRNKRRVIRLIENAGKMPSRQQIRENTLLLGISIPRSELDRRVNERVEAMLKAGLEHEVKVLAEKYGWQSEPMKSIGYREWIEYFNGQQSYEETRQKIIRNTMLLAKKQRTWFRRNKSIQWVENKSVAVDATTTFLNKK